LFGVLLVFILRHFFLFSCFIIWKNFITLGFIYSFYPCPIETLNESNFICWFFFYFVLPFVLLRQKWRVFFDLD